MVYFYYIAETLEKFVCHNILVDKYNIITLLLLQKITQLHATLCKLALSKMINIVSNKTVLLLLHS